ncbi:glycosyl hydrolase [Pseudomonas sp. S31]|uniref:WD40/YVTN/BNR-like repeat-containing protein n=1 Tax=Pseudomonas sp. S31 TaxID=1564473 RepID=UPI0019134FCF|nr:YCF48-related protein [Pseudomonas sp. S31]MBK5002412.1 glycosyl hydrolase [Pseudomonas sp. S31]
MTAFVLRAALIAAVFLPGMTTVAHAAGVPDLLELPAQADVRASRSQMLGLARAGERLVAVGERGLVLLSDDAGRSWRQAREVPVSVALTDVTFVNATDGWAVGHSGVILHSTDGGERWSVQMDGRQAAQRMLEQASERKAAGQENAEAEVRAAEYLVQDGPDKPFLSVAFADSRRGYAVGAYGVAMMTQDAGKTWHSLLGAIANPSGKHLYQVRVSGQRLLIAGEQGALFLSRDGGSRFTTLDSPYEGTFFGALDLGHGVLLAYGLRGNAWRSEDEGQSWIHLDMRPKASLGVAQRLSDGSLLLGNEGGRLMQGRASGQAFVELPQAVEGALTGIAENPDGSLVLAGTQGLQRLDNLRDGGHP